MRNKKQRLGPLGWSGMGAVRPNAPVITSNGGGSSATVNVSTGATAVTTVVAKGVGPIGYSISGGPNASLFVIDGVTGVLRFISTSVDGNYVVTVTASNAGGSDSQIITVAAASYIGPLDLVSGAVVAYGQRALSAAKLGSALYTIRENGGNTTHSFNSDASTGAAPVASITAFLNGANGYIATWNDQSGNGYDGSSPDSTQLQWETNVFGTIPGGVITQAGGSVDSAITVPAVSAGLTVFCVCKFVQTGGPSIVGAETGTNRVFEIGTGYNTNGDMYVALKDDGGGNEVDWITSGIVLSNANHLVEAVVAADGTITGLVDGTNVNLTIDFGSQRSIQNNTVQWTVPATNRANNGSGELIVYNSSLSSGDRLAVRQNMASYYGITLV